MRRRWLVVSATVFAAMLVRSSSPFAQVEPARTDSVAAYRVVLDRYCVTCHNQRAKTAGVTFDTMDLANLGAGVDTWEKVIRKLRAGMMPPPGMPRPDAAQLDSFANWLEVSLDREAADRPDPGRVALHRLNRTEYANAIEDLLALRIDASALLPKDGEADGFDNVATALKVSPTFLDQYIAAARAVSVKAVGAAPPKPDSTMYRPPRGTDQMRHVDGLPPGTRGGFAVTHLFPADGDYKFNIGGLAGAFYLRGLEYQHTVVLTIDGKRVFQQQVGGEEDSKLIEQKQAPAVAQVNARFQNIAANVSAGPHLVGVTFVAHTYAESDEAMQPLRLGAGEDRIPNVANLEILGPFNARPGVDTPSRARIFVCRPAANATSAAEEACATRILTPIVRRAFRRAVSAEDLVAPLAFFRQARANGPSTGAGPSRAESRGGGFEEGIQSALTAILASPNFLFRAESVPAASAGGGVYRIADTDLASRLAFFLTASPPDDQLLDAAAAVRLHDRQVLDQQVRRLLADPRAGTLVTNFAFQWLKLRGLDDIDPDTLQFPNFDPSLREALKREMELFVATIFREDRSVLDLLTADYTFVNERLARHYDIPGVRGYQFRRVTLTDPNRFGLLGKGAVLMATSYANRTAPVIRGAWILENVLGTPPASPPPNVEAFKENKAGEKALTVRQIIEQHRANPTCNACHGVMDPIGFSLENFDAIGGWRTNDRFAGETIDPSGVLVDGTTVRGPVDLRNAIMRHPDRFVQTFVERLMTYGLGRSLDGHDMPAVRAIVRAAAADGYRFSSIVLGIVNSAPFQMRKSS
jgi:mono/diheme cytochrome c family protein